jgi:hypothetical protein
MSETLVAAYKGEVLKIESGLEELIGLPITYLGE